jgi:phosphocarrier protein FPr
MVGLVLVSHCRALAEAAAVLARGVAVGVTVPIAAAGGAGDDHADLGTDAMDILAAIETVASPEGVLVLMDLGSAILSTKLALDFLDPDMAAKVVLCSAPLVEGAVSAAVQIAAGSDLAAVKAEAIDALGPKQADLDEEDAAVSGGSIPPPPKPTGCPRPPQTGGKAPRNAPGIPRRCPYLLLYLSLKKRPPRTPRRPARGRPRPVQRNNNYRQ